ERPAAPEEGDARDPERERRAGCGEKGTFCRGRGVGHSPGSASGCRIRLQTVSLPVYASIETPTGLTARTGRGPQRRTAPRTERPPPGGCGPGGCAAARRCSADLAGGASGAGGGGLTRRPRRPFALL